LQSCRVSVDGAGALCIRKNANFSFRNSSGSGNCILAALGLQKPHGLIAWNFFPSLAMKLRASLANKQSLASLKKGEGGGELGTSVMLSMQLQGHALELGNQAKTLNFPSPPCLCFFSPACNQQQILARNAVLFFFSL